MVLSTPIFTLRLAVIVIEKANDEALQLRKKKNDFFFNTYHT